MVSFLMVPRPPRPTLLPCTTLYPSNINQGEGDNGHHQHQPGEGGAMDIININQGEGDSGGTEENNNINQGGGGWGNMEIQKHHPGGGGKGTS